MTKFKNYVNEELDEEKLVQLLKPCKPFINDWKKTNSFGCLYSGRRGATKKWFEKKVRKDRKPLSTPVEIHNIIDKRFQEAFGIKARSQTVFCVSDINTAKEYGVPYYIFPKGKYEIIWSNTIDDLYTNLTEWIAFHEPELKDMPVLERLNKDFESHKKYFDYLKNKFPVKKLYQKGNLKQALKTGYEIMLYCNEYVGIQWPNENLRNILKDI